MGDRRSFMARCAHHVKCLRARLLHWAASKRARRDLAPQHALLEATTAPDRNPARTTCCSSSRRKRWGCRPSACPRDDAGQRRLRRRGAMRPSAYSRRPACRRSPAGRDRPQARLRRPAERGVQAGALRQVLPLDRPCTAGSPACSPSTPPTGARRLCCAASALTRAQKQTLGLVGESNTASP